MANTKKDISHTSTSQSLSGTNHLTVSTYSNLNNKLLVTTQKKHPPKITPHLQNVHQQF